MALFIHRRDIFVDRCTAPTIFKTAQSLFPHPELRRRVMLKDWPSCSVLTTSITATTPDPSRTLLAVLVKYDFFTVVPFNRAVLVLVHGEAKLLATACPRKWVFSFDLIVPFLRLKRALSGPWPVQPMCSACLSVVHDIAMFVVITTSAAGLAEQGL